VSLVDEEHRSQPVGVGDGGEVLLNAAHQDGVDAGGLGTDGGGDLAAHIALRETSDLDVVDAISGLGQLRAQNAQEGGFAGAGGSDQRCGYALVDDAPQGGERLVEELQAEALVDGDFAGERCAVETEPATQVLDLHRLLLVGVGTAAVGIDDGRKLALEGEVGGALG